MMTAALTLSGCGAAAKKVAQEVVKGGAAAAGGAVADAATNDSQQDGSGPPPARQFSPPVAPPLTANALVGFYVREGGSGSDAHWSFSNSKSCYELFSDGSGLAAGYMTWDDRGDNAGPVTVVYKFDFDWKLIGTRFDTRLRQVTVNRATPRSPFQQVALREDQIDRQMRNRLNEDVNANRAWKNSGTILTTGQRLVRRNSDGTLMTANRVGSDAECARVVNADSGMR